MTENYYEIDWDLGGEQYMIGEMLRLSNNSNLEKYTRKVNFGEELQVEEFLIEVEGLDREEPDLLYMAGQLFVSGSLRMILEKKDANMEFTSVKLVNHESNTNYWHCNILNNLDVFNWKKSVFKADTKMAKGNYEEWDQTNYTPDKINETTSLLKVDKLVLQEDKIQNRHLFQVKYLEVHKFVSRELKEAIEAAGITGVKFIPLSEFTSGF